MQPYDIAMLAVLLIATLLGAWKGMAWQIASLASLVASYFMAVRFGATLAPMFGDKEPMNRFIAMLVIYVGTSMVIWLLFRIVAGVIDRVRLKEFDRQVGGLIGAAKGVLLCVVITFFAVTLSADSRQMVLDSRSGHYISVLIDRARPIMPDDLRQVLEPYLKRLDDGLDPGHQTLPPVRSVMGRNRSAGEWS
ncbi:MAG: CvpA family protein [Pirellulales bacterium]|nr:CvpA family protein [Pirellulales bacterium]